METKQYQITPFQDCEEKREKKFEHRKFFFRKTKNFLNKKFIRADVPQKPLKTSINFLCTSESQETKQPTFFTKTCHCVISLIHKLKKSLSFFFLSKIQTHFATKLPTGVLQFIS